MAQLGWFGRRAAAIATVLALGVVAPVAAGAEVTPAAVPAVTTVPGSGNLIGVACPTASTCIAVGDKVLAGGVAVGIVVVLRDGVPDAAQQVPGVVSLYGVACTSPSRCLAVGQGPGRGVTVAIADGVPGAPSPVEGTSLLSRISCSFGPCLAVATTTSGDRGVVTIDRGRPRLHLTAPRIILADVSCGLLTGCFGVGYEGDPDAPGGSWGVSMPIVSGRPGPPTRVPGTINIPGISCVLRCQAAGTAWTGNGFQGLSVGIGPGAAPLVAVPGTFGLSRVSCAGWSECLAVGDRYVGGGVVPIVRGVPGAVQPVNGSSLINDVACTASGCLAVGFQGGFGSPIGVVASVPYPR